MFNARAYRLIQNKMYTSQWLNTDFAFSVGQAVGYVCIDNKSLFSKYDELCVLYVIKRSVKYGEKYYYVKDVDGKTLNHRFKEDELFMSSVMRNPMLIECDIVNFRVSDTGIDEYRVRWTSLKEKHDTWVSKAQYEYLVFDRHRRFGVAWCGCPNLRKVNILYTDPETRKKNKNSLWLHRAHKVPCFKNKKGVLVHKTEKCGKEYKAKKAHVLGVKTVGRLYKL